METQNACRSPQKIRFGAGNHGEFYAVLKRRVAGHLAARGASRYPDWRLWMKAAGYTAVAAVAYMLVVTSAWPPWTLLLLAIAYNLAVLLLAINVAHDAAHDALSPRRWVNRMIQSAIFQLLGVNGYLWRLRHVKSHHTFPNVNGCDIDIDENPFLRLSPNHPRRPWQRFQHLYAPLTYWAVALHTIFYQDFVYLRKRRLANMTDIRHPWWAHVLFVMGKAAYLTITFVIPLAVIDLPWWHILLGILIASGASSILFVGLLIGTHFAEEAAFPSLDEQSRLPHDWAEHALLTAVDWSPTNLLAHFLAGGANAHAAHHLFPTICHIHYRDIVDIIRTTAQEFGLRYNVTTLPRMIESHFRFLRLLGSEVVQLKMDLSARPELDTNAASGTLGSRGKMPRSFLAPRYFVTVLVALSTSGCITVGMVNDITVSSVRAVIRQDQPELPVTNESNNELLLKVEFTSGADLSRFEWSDNLRHGVDACDKSSGRVIVGLPGIFSQGMHLPPRLGQEAAVWQKFGLVRAPFTYYIFIPVARAGNSPNGPWSFDLRHDPLDICFQLSGGWIYASWNRSKIATIPKNAIAEALQGGQ